MFFVTCCDVRYDFHIKTMFGPICLYEGFRLIYVICECQFHVYFTSVVYFIIEIHTL
jgi:hypothetical protein